MAASLLPKDLPKEAQHAATRGDDHLPHHHHHAHHAHSHHPLIHDPPESDSDSASEDDTPPSHSHHAHHHSDDDHPTFDLSHTPFAGLYTHLISSIPLITSLLLRLLLITNIVSIILGLFRVLSPTGDSCSVSLLTPSGDASFSRLLLSLFFDSTYPSAFTTLFAIYELGSRIETQLGSTFFLIISLLYSFSITSLYSLLLTLLPSLRLYPCSCGVWPLVIALLITENYWNRALPRSFPLLPYPLPTLLYPLLLILIQQLTFSIHSLPLFSLIAGYVVAGPVVMAGLGCGSMVEGCVGRWLSGSKRFVSRDKAGKMPPWSPIVINRDDDDAEGEDEHSHQSPEPELPPVDVDQSSGLGARSSSVTSRKGVAHDGESSDVELSLTRTDHSREQQTLLS